MPLYEGLGIVQEKHSIVIEIGHAYTKCGFAREYSPRWIIPSEVEHPITKKVEKIWHHVQDPDTLCLLLREFFYCLYFKYLVVNPKDRRLVVVESVLCPLSFRNALARVVFGHFDAPSLLYVPGHVMAVLTLGTPSALVVDVGYQETLVLPVFHGVTVLKAWEATPLGGQAVHKRLTELLKDKEENALDEKVLEEIKVQTCLIRPQGCQAIPPDVQFPLGGNQMLIIPGSLRAEAGEVMFEEDADERDLASLLISCLEQCPVDSRRALAAGILVIGGGAMIPGFTARLRHQLLSRLPSSRILAPNIRFCFHRPPTTPSTCAWLGGAILGSTDVVAARSVSRDEWMRKGPGSLPDWSVQREYPSGNVPHQPVHPRQQIAPRQRTASKDVPMVAGANLLKS